MNRRLAVAILCGVSLAGSAALPVVLAAEQAPEGTVVLNAASYWRYSITCRTPVMRKGQELVEMKGSFPNTALPPTDWFSQDFDDHLWSRVRGPFFRTTRGHAYVPAVEGKGYTMYEHGGPSMALLCARGRFMVTDPGSVGDLTLSLAYRGGAVVYVNGKEVARGHLPDTDKKGLEALAEDYDNEVCLDADGRLIGIGPNAAKNADRLEKRIRRLAGVKVPAASLRRGINVLAVEIHRAPYPKAILKSVAAHNVQTFDWVPMGLVGLELRAAGTGVVPNVGRPKGLQAWTHCPSQRVYVDQYDEGLEPLRPVRIAAARNGAFTGQILVGSSEAIRGLKVQPSELQCPGGALDNLVQVRYPAPDGRPGGMALFDSGQGFPNCFDTLRDDVPAEVAPPKGSGGVVQPIWLTVRVPKGAKPGKYTGKVAVQAEGAAAVDVPVELTVADWTLPDPKDFETHVGMVESPDSVAMQYGVEPWSERHLALLGQVFALMGQTGPSDLYITLQSRLHVGNEHSMVRWVRKEGGYACDFSIAEQYLDVALKNMGRPRAVCLWCWDKHNGLVYGNKANPNKPCRFTVLDPKSGKLEEAEGPAFGTPEAREFWRPVFDGLRAVLKERGLEKAMMLGVLGDSYPTRVAFEDLRAAAPGVKWVVRQHPEPRGSMHGVPVKDFVGYYSYVYNRELPDPAVKRSYGWQGDEILRTCFPRPGGVPNGNDLQNNTLAARYRAYLEGAITYGVRGIGGIGADFWPALKQTRPGARSYYRLLANRYPDNDWIQLSISAAACSLVAPGPDGPLSTVRYEMLREGIQECQARILIEKALLDPAQKAKLGEALARRCREALDSRQRQLIACCESWWCFSAEDWEERALELYGLAAELAKALGQ